MDNCFSSYYNSGGSLYSEVSLIPQFRIIKNHIKQRTSSLINENDKSNFRKGCLYLADYLIKYNKPPQYYEDYKVTWKGALNKSLSGYYRNLEKHGGCPLILEEKDKNILELKYKEVDFCEKKGQYLKEIKQLQRKHLQNCNDQYLKKCKEYKEWINERKIYFDENKTLFKDCYKTNKRQTFICNIRDKKSFIVPTECISSNLEETCQVLPKEEVKSLQKQTDSIDKSTFTSPVQIEHGVKITEGQGRPQEQIQLESNSQLQAPPLSSEIDSTQDRTSDIPRILSSQDVNSASLKDSISEHERSQKNVTLQQTNSYIDPPHSETTSSVLPVSFPSTRFPNRVESSIILEFLRKKEKIGRKYLKLLRLVVPSFSNRKGEFSSYDKLENPIYYDEEIIKKLKINEYYNIKNLNSSRRKEERSKTIIEVHMEVLEKCKNKEWELNKGQFLVICLEEFTRDKYRTYPNITNEEILTGNSKFGSNLKKKSILWSKWMEGNIDLSEKLKKTDFFNNLKNEWKKEQAYLNKLDKLKKNNKNDIQKFPLLEREKELWRQWINKKNIIIEQYLEKNLFSVLTQEFLNISDEYDNKIRNKDISPINIEELRHKENYEELSKYIKKELLTNVCILILMMIFEECKKEEYIENGESYFDSFIAELKEKEYYDCNPEFLEDITEVNRDDLENIENIDNKEASFRNEIENWITEYDTYVNSMNK
ncbi:uncharacterized protein MKS88_000183 [Plasmodium brasilianum]|uniref:uncharacterized protein n=1 Tax=Plasmodium brasilianum TaxID=5824 RepID=UPI00350E36AE|nr:hypothetical protein MKS88_000183 [Plasmodium brasilianum]